MRRWKLKKNLTFFLIVFIYEITSDMLRNKDVKNCFKTFFSPFHSRWLTKKIMEACVRVVFLMNSESEDVNYNCNLLWLLICNFYLQSTHNASRSQYHTGSGCRSGAGSSYIFPRYWYYPNLFWHTDPDHFAHARVFGQSDVTFHEPQRQPRNLRHCW